MRDVIAMDTGAMTGIATWTSGGHYAWALPEDDAMSWTRDAVVGGRFRGVIICERITINAQTHKKGDHVLASVEQIGYLRHLCKDYGLEFDNSQSPGEAKPFSTDRKLRAMGWWTSSDHARDASRHLMLYMCKESPEFARELLGRMEDEGGA